MPRFKEMPLSEKLSIGYGALIMFLLILGAASIYRMIRANENIVSMDKTIVAPMEKALSAEIYALLHVKYLYNLIIAPTEEEKSRIKNELKSQELILKSKIEDLKSNHIDDNNREILLQFNGVWEKYKSGVTSIIELSDQGLREEAIKAMLEVEPLAAQVDDTFVLLVDLNLAKSEVTKKQGAKELKNGVVTSVLLLVVALALAVFITLYQIRSIEQPLKAAAEIAKSGDLSKKLEVNTTDSIGMLMEAYNAMTERLKRKTHEVTLIADGDLTADIEAVSDKDELGFSIRGMRDNLRDLVNDVRIAATNMNAGTEELSSASQVLAQGAQKQTATLESLSNAVNQINSQAQLNSEKSVETNEAAKMANILASEGKEKISSTLESMQEISEASGNVAKIIKVIDNIAFQTNLLALNAAVEAARAGSAGRGFAVVAEEVRSLASRSATAAKETSNLIQSTVKKIAQGVEVTKDTAYSFQKIVDEITSVTELVSDIAAASEKQSNATSEVADSIREISGVIQLNSSTSEQTASSAVELSKQADDLQKLVAKFKT